MEVKKLHGTVVAVGDYISIQQQNSIMGELEEGVKHALMYREVVNKALKLLILFLKTRKLSWYISRCTGLRADRWIAFFRIVVHNYSLIRNRCRNKSGNGPAYSLSIRSLLSMRSSSK